MPFSGRVNESSSPHMGTGFNGGVPGASITMSGDRNGTTTFSTDGSGNYSSEYYPESLPTLTATKWGLSTTGSPGSTMTLYTDATMKLGLASGCAAGSDGQTFTVTGSPNGGAGVSISRGLFTSPSVPALIKVPRSGSSDSTLAITGIDHPRFTWAGEGALNASQSAAIGKIASGTMRVDTMHKWVKVHVDLEQVNGPLTEDASDAQITVYDYENDGAGKPVYSTKFGLPTAILANGSSRAQTNPVSAGVFDVYFWTLNRIGTAAAPYRNKFRIRVENDMYISTGEADNETFTITDAMRKSGVGNITIKLLLKGGGK